MSTVEQHGNRRQDDLERDRAEGERSGVEEWRGVAAEHNDEMADRASGFLKKRSRALLADLLRPYLKVVWLLIAVVVIENAARLAIPWLVYRGIDYGIPPLLAGGSGTALYETIGLMLGALVVQTISRMIFLRESGRVGQKVLLELRRRLFVHFQKLDVKFHDRYTTGRVVSRLTNDIDAIMELLAGGFDGLVTAVLTMVGVGVLLLAMDFKLGAVCLIGFPILMLLVRWFSRSSSLTYRRVRETSALVIVQFIETMTGIRAVQAYRREPRNAEIFSDVAHRYQDANVKSFRLVAIFMPRRPAGRQRHHRHRAAVRRLAGDAGRDDHRRADRVPALPADVLRADAGDQPVLQHLPVGVGRAGEAVRACWRRIRPCGSRSTRCRCRTRAGRSASMACTSRTCRSGPSCPDWTCACRPGRRWPWWARPAPARRRSRS